MSRQKIRTGRSGELGKLRDRSLHIRVSSEEMKQLEDKATSQRTSTAKFCRDALLYKKVHKANIKQQTELLNQLNKIGVNLNQIAHRINKGELFIIEEFQEILTSFKTLKKQQYTRNLNDN